MTRRVSSKSSTKSTFRSLESLSPMVAALWHDARLKESAGRTKFTRNKFPALVVKDPEYPFTNPFEAAKMKRIVILVVLVLVAGLAGMVVRSSRGAGAELRELVTHSNASDVRQEIRQSYKLTPGARVGVR